MNSQNSVPEKNHGFSSILPKGIAMVQGFFCTSKKDREKFIKWIIIVLAGFYFSIFLGTRNHPFFGPLDTVHLLGPHIGIEQSEGLFSCTSRRVPFFEQNHWVWGINMVWNMIKLYHIVSQNNMFKSIQIQHRGVDVYTSTSASIQLEWLGNCSRDQTHKPQNKW